MKAARFGDGQITILTGIIWDRQPDLCGDYIVRVKAGTDLEDLPEAAEEQQGRPRPKGSGKGRLPTRPARSRRASLVLLKPEPRLPSLRLVI